jgi:hypothetical protein
MRHVPNLLHPIRAWSGELAPLILLTDRQPLRRFDLVLFQPLSDLAPDILRPEQSVAGDAFQHLAKVGRDGLGLVGHGHSIRNQCSACVLRRKTAFSQRNHRSRRLARHQAPTAPKDERIGVNGSL